MLILSRSSQPTHRPFVKSCHAVEQVGILWIVAMFREEVVEVLLQNQLHAHLLQHPVQKQHDMDI